jgi:two-component system LytT family sensor kinase
LGEELKIIAAYLEIESARFEDRLVVRIDVSEELHRLSIPTFLLQPLVENAIKHGISQSVTGGEVRITADLTDQPATLHVVIEDTGSGGDEAHFLIGRTHGVGLNNVEKRLQYYGQDAASMRITSKPGMGTRVEILLPAGTAPGTENHSQTISAGRT